MTGAMHRVLAPRRLWALMALAAFGSVGLALLAQHRWDLQPCPWCVLQRLIFLLIGTLSLLGAVSGAGQPGRHGRALVTALPVGLLALAGGAAALYQHLVAAKSPSCNLTLADRIVSGLGLDAALPEVFEVRASCADAAVSVLGVPFEFWGLALHALLLLAALHLLRHPARR